MNSTLSRMSLSLASAALIVSCASTRLHQQGLNEFDQGRYETALQKLQQAVISEPGNLSYKLDLKGRRDEAVQKLVAEGDKARAAGVADAAAEAYNRVLAIESGNSRATRGIDGVDADRRHAKSVLLAGQEFQQGNAEQADTRLSGVLSEDPGFAPATALRAKIDAARGPVTVTPKLHTRDNRPVTLQFRDAQTKMVFEVLSRQTGINFIFDKDIKSDSKTTIFVQEVPIEQAIDLVLGQNQLARQVLSENMVLIYPNTAAKQKDYQDQIIKTFYLNTANPKDVEGLLKTVLEAKTLVINERAGAIVMRDTPENIRMAEKLVASVDLSEPEVMMEVEVLEINRDRMQQLGIAYPSSATLSAAPLHLNALHRQNSSTISVSPLSVTLDALKKDDNSNVLASPRIRARNKEKAKILIGQREPTITQQNTIAGGSIAPSTNVQYLDVGLKLEVEPTIYADNDVAIQMNLEVSSIIRQLTITSPNAGTTIAYEIGTRNASTLLQLKDGETQILAGLIQDSDTRSATKVPGLGDIPILGRLFSDHSTEKKKSEIVLAITPRIIRAKPRPSSDTTEFWFGTESRSGLSPMGAASATHAAGMTTMPPSAGGMGRSSASVAGQDVSSLSGGQGGVSGGSGAAGAPTGVPSARVTALQGVTEVPSGKPTETDGPVPHPTSTLSGPSEVKVGDEFTVTVQLQSDQNIAHVRSQVRFDSAAFQLLSGDAGAMVPSAIGAKVNSRSGGAQLDVTAPADALMPGSGDLMVLKFKALQARAQTAFAAQISVMGGSGAIMGSSTPTPLTITVTN